MAKRSFPTWLDEGNQRSVDYLRAHPEAGTEIHPFAKSDRSRRSAVMVTIAAGLSGFFFGWVGGLIALVVAIPFAWKLEHHFFFERELPSDPDSDRDSEGGSVPP